MKHVDPAVLCRVPLQLVVPPVLLHPEVGRHDLVLQVLQLSPVNSDSQIPSIRCEWSHYFWCFCYIKHKTSSFSPSLTYHGYELGKLKLKFDGDNFWDIWDGSDQFVVIGKEVIVQSLGVWIATKNKHFHGFHIITSTTVWLGEGAVFCSIK